MRHLIVIFVAVALSQARAEKMRFDNHTLYRITPKTKQMVETLRNLEELAYFNGYNFFSQVASEHVPVDILVPPAQADRFKDILEHSDVESTLLNKNIQEAIDNENVGSATRTTGFGWTRYHTLEEIEEWMKDLAFNYGNRVTLLLAGYTYEGRPILGVKISHPSYVRKQAVFIEANIHAREWITSAVATFIINQLILGTNSEVRQLAELYDWYIFPVFNPDGFAYSHNENRLWRKTRTPYCWNCFGADPNRNWPYRWMQGGASNDPYHLTYAGPHPLSEKSTASLAYFIDTIGHDLIAYISLHCFAQKLLLPYGHTTEALDNYAEMMEIGRQAIRDLSKRHNTQYKIGNIGEIMGIATGSSMDYVKHKYGTPIVYCYELRPSDSAQGDSGFILPADQIIDTSEETLDSLISIFRSYRQRHPVPRS